MQRHEVIGTAGLSAGRNIGSLAGTLTKAAFVDFPMALTEGLYQMPTLYGGKVRDHGAVTDWKSGAAVAGKVSSLVILLSGCALLN